MAHKKYAKPKEIFLLRLLSTAESHASGFSHSSVAVGAQTCCLVVKEKDLHSRGDRQCGLTRFFISHGVIMELYFLLSFILTVQCHYFGNKVHHPVGQHPNQAPFVIWQFFGTPPHPSLFQEGSKHNLHSKQSK